MGNESILVFGENEGFPSFLSEVFGLFSSKKMKKIMNYAASRQALG